MHRGKRGGARAKEARREGKKRGEAVAVKEESLQGKLLIIENERGFRKRVSGGIKFHHPKGRKLKQKFQGKGSCYCCPQAGGKNSAQIGEKANDVNR